MDERYLIRIQPNARKRIDVIEVSPHIRESASLFLRYLQNLVSGHVQVVPLGAEGYLVAVNEVGKLIGLSHNRWMEEFTSSRLNGNAIILKSEADRLEGLTAEDVRRLAERL